MIINIVCVINILFEYIIHIFSTNLFLFSIGPSQAEGFGQYFNISSNHDENVFYADVNGAVVGKGKLRVTGEPGNRPAFKKRKRNALLYY